MKNDRMIESEPQCTKKSFDGNYLKEQAKACLVHGNGKYPHTYYMDCTTISLLCG